MKAIFLLLQKHGLDYPKYYEKLYALLLPQFQQRNGQTVSVFTMNTQEKSKFLRLLDLSLRSSKLPSRVIAAFIKRMMRLVVCEGVCHTQADQMFVISLAANLVKRHPRCVRLVHWRQSKLKANPTFESDPFRLTEKDPAKARALKSSLWELDCLMNSGVDETVRNYSKLFKGDISRKTTFFKCEDFAGSNSLELIGQDLQSIDIPREVKAINKSILIKHNQWNDEADKLLGQKRTLETPTLDLNPSNYKQMRLAEKYTQP